MDAPDELRPDDPRLRAILGDPDGVIVSWMIVARTAGMDSMGGLIIATDDNCDVVTHMGLAAAANADAVDRVQRLGEDDD
jgi:hypothetical protein